MCEPITIGLAAIAVGSQVAGGISSANAAKKQSKADIAAAGRAFTQTVGDIEAQRDEIARAAMGERAQLQQVAAQEQGSVQTAVAENGVTGASPTALSNQFDRALMQALQINTENLALKNKQLDREIEGAAAGAQGRINQAKAAAPSAFGTALSVGTGAFNAALPFIPRPGK
jgi:hypothetical protein